MKLKEIPLSESLEDYLEIILDLEKTNKVARVKDISERMGVQPAAVTGALKSLGEKGLIHYAPYRFITLTEKGTRIAREITRRHDILKDFLLRVLQVDAQRAEAAACRMEHAIDAQTIDKLLKFIKFIDNCPRTGSDWVQAFLNYCATDTKNPADCLSCLETCRHQYDIRDPTG